MRARRGAWTAVNVNGVFEGGNSYVPIHGTVDQYCLPSAMVSAQINNLANESPDPELNYKTADMSPWEYVQCIQNAFVCAMQHGGLQSFPQCFPFGMRQSPCCRCLSTDHVICESDITKAAEWFKKGFLEMKGALRNSNTAKPPATNDWVKTWKKPVALKGSGGGAGKGKGGGRGRGRGRGGGRGNGKGRGRGRGQPDASSQQTNSLSVLQTKRQDKDPSSRRVTFSELATANYYSSLAVGERLAEEVEYENRGSQPSVGVITPTVLVEEVEGDDDDDHASDAGSQVGKAGSMAASSDDKPKGAMVNQAQGQRMVDTDDPNFKQYTQESLQKEQGEWTNAIAKMQTESDASNGKPYHSKRGTSAVQGVRADASAHKDGFEGASDSDSDSENDSLSEEESDEESGHVATCMNLSTDKWSPNVRDLTVTVRPLPESLLQFKSVVIKVDGGKDMTCSEIRDIVLAGGIEADYLSRVPSCRKTGSLLVTATACTSVWTHGQTGNHVKFGVDIGYLSLDVPFWDKVAATCASEADPSHMTVYVGVPLNRLEGGMDGCASDNQDKQNQNCGEEDASRRFWFGGGDVIRPNQTVE